MKKPSVDKGGGVRNLGRVALSPTSRVNKAGKALNATAIKFRERMKWVQQEHAAGKLSENDHDLFLEKLEQSIEKHKDSQAVGKKKHEEKKKAAYSQARQALQDAVDGGASLEEVTAFKATADAAKAGYVKDGIHSPVDSLRVLGPDTFVAEYDAVLAVNGLKPDKDGCIIVSKPMKNIDIRQGRAGFRKVFNTNQLHSYGLPRMAMIAEMIKSGRDIEYITSSVTADVEASHRCHKGDVSCGGTCISTRCIRAEPRSVNQGERGKCQRLGMCICKFAGTEDKCYPWK